MHFKGGGFKRGCHRVKIVYCSKYDSKLIEGGGKNMFDRNNHSSSNRRPKNTLKLITNQVVMNNLCQVPNFLIKNKLDEIYLKCLTSCHRCLTSCHRCSFFRLIQDGIHQLLQFSIFIIVRITKNIAQIILAFIHVSVSI